MRGYDLVIFDMDGTLVDSDGAHTEMFDRFWGLYFPNLEGFDVIQNGKGKALPEVFRGAGLDERLIDDIFDKLDHFYEHDADDIIGNMRFIDGSTSVIRALRESGVHTVMISNSAQALVQKISHANGMEREFDMVSGAERNDALKSVRFKEILEKTGIAPGRALYIGDSEMDVEAAHSCGMDCCILYTPISWAVSAQALLENHDPDFVVKDVKRILQIVL